MNTKYKFSEKDKHFIINEYINGKVVKDIARIYNCSKSVILNKLKEWNIPRRNRKERNRKYTLDRNFFNQIDTKEKAYFLGLLYADGYNREDYGTITINLQENDKEILEKFNQIIHSNCPLRFWKKRKKNHQNQYVLSIHDMDMSMQLSKLGCMKKKSLILKFPTEEQVPKYLLWNFIRRI